MYCGVEFIDSLLAKYCIDCYNKYGEWDCECKEATGECICEQ